MFETISGSPCSPASPTACATPDCRGKCSSSCRVWRDCRARACRRGSASAARRPACAKKHRREAALAEDVDLPHLFEHPNLGAMSMLGRALVGSKLEQTWTLRRGRAGHLDARHLRKRRQQRNLLSNVNRIRGRCIGVRRGGADELLILVELPLERQQRLERVCTASSRTPLAWEDRSSPRTRQSGDDPTGSALEWLPSAGTRPTGEAACPCAGRYAATCRATASSNPTLASDPPRRPKRQPRPRASCQTSSS